MRADKRPILTPRQIDVVKLGALGLPDKEIAFRMGLSVETVKTQFARMRMRIGRFDRAMLPAIALLLGLVTIEEVTAGAYELLRSRRPLLTLVSFERRAA